MATARNSQGITFAIQGDYASAADHFSKSIDIANQISNDRVLSLALNNMGNISRDLGQHELAIEYFMRSLEIKKRMNNQQGIGNAYLNIGSSFSVQGKSDSALIYFSKSLVIFKELQYIRGIGLAQKNIGNAYQEMKKYDLALEYMQSSMIIRDSLGRLKDIASSLSDLGALYFDMSIDPARNSASSTNLKRAIEYAQKAYNLSSQQGFVREQKKSARVLYLANKKMKRFDVALGMYIEHIMLRDSINNKESQSSLLRQEFQHEYDKEKAISDTEHRKDIEKHEEIAEEDKEQQNIIIVAISVVLLLILVFAIFIFKRLRISKQQNEIIAEQKLKVDQAFDILEEKNTEILDSITYAKRIQKAILPPDSIIKTHLKNSFVLYKPKDIVAGDFYWLETVGDIVLFAAADCTGHGVPGAMVSVICNNGLNRSVREYKLSKPNEILDKTREIVIQEFEKSEDEVKDGMDIALCAVDLGNPQNPTVEFSGAHNPIWIIRKGSSEIEEIKGDKQPIGKFSYGKPFNNHTLKLNTGDTFYLFSDGYSDQFGGEKGKKFKSANFKKLLLSIQHLNMMEQKEELDKTFEKWKENYEQLDDVCIIGVSV